MVVSVFASLYGITSRVSADDKPQFREQGSNNENEYAHDRHNMVGTRRVGTAHLYTYDWHNMVGTRKVGCIPCITPLWCRRVILWRFVEITCRVFLLMLIWINLGGAALMIILALEALVCLVIAYGYKSYVSSLCM